MAQWDETLQAILNDPQTMGQLFSIAQSISGGESSSPTDTNDTPQQPSDQFPLEEITPSEEVDTPLELPEMNPLLALGGLGDIDPKLLSLGITLLSSFSQEDNRSATLLQALKPYLSEKHLKHMDKAIQLSRYSRVIATAYQIYRQERGGEHV